MVLKVNLKFTKNSQYFVFGGYPIVLVEFSIPVKSNQFKSFIYHSPNSTAQKNIYNYDNLLCDRTMVVDLCCYAGLSGSSAGLGIELALFSSHSCQNAEPDWTC